MKTPEKKKTQLNNNSIVTFKNVKKPVSTSFLHNILKQLKQLL